MTYKEAYIDFLKKGFKVKKKLTIVCDASNGPTGLVVKDLFQGTSVEVIVINDRIDPDFSAHSPNPLQKGATDDCSKAVIKHHANLGVVFDGDGDRAVFVDNTGKVVPAFLVAILLFKQVSFPYIVDELIYQSIRMVDVIPDKELIASRIGSYFIKKQIKDSHAACAAEFTGHYYFKEFFGLDSGIFTLIKVLNIVSTMDESLAEWVLTYGEMETIIKEIPIEGKDMNRVYQELEKVYTSQAVRVDKIDGVTFVFEHSWVNVRASNTEPILRIIASGRQGMAQVVGEIAKLLTKI